MNVLKCLKVISTAKLYNQINISLITIIIIYYIDGAPHRYVTTQHDSPRHCAYKPLCNVFLEVIACIKMRIV
jgi:hypothetical protein